jgi:hypothetical protein
VDVLLRGPSEPGVAETADAHTRSMTDTTLPGGTLSLTPDATIPHLGYGPYVTNRLIRQAIEHLRENIASAGLELSTDDLLELEGIAG